MMIIGKYIIALIFIFYSQSTSAQYTCYKSDFYYINSSGGRNRINKEISICYYDSSGYYCYINIAGKSSMFFSKGATSYDTSGEYKIIWFNSNGGESRNIPGDDAMVMFTKIKNKIICSISFGVVGIGYGFDAKEKYISKSINATIYSK